MRGTFIISAIAFAASITAAHAALTISNKPTANVSCEAGVCTATDADAVMNAAELAQMLDTSDVTLSTTFDPLQDIVVASPFAWTGTHGLTLVSSNAIYVRNRFTVQGTAHLTLNVEGEAIFGAKGSIKFWDLASRLTINGQDYRLVNSVAGLADMVTRHPNGFIAFANDYNAHQDSQVRKVPVATPFNGTLEGLGNRISNFSIWDTTENEVALFRYLKPRGAIRDFGMLNTNVLSENTFTNIAATLVAYNGGTIMRCWASGGEVRSDFDVVAGGLVGENYGNIFYSWANVRVSGAVSAEVGGLIGNTHGHVHDVYATGRVIAGDQADVGGLVGYDIGHVRAAYATGDVDGGQNARVGGLLGSLVLRPIADTYWDTETSGTAFGAGGHNVDGITGLTTGELQAELPAGLDPAIWGRDPEINNGLPYLLSNPPR